MKVEDKDRLKSLFQEMKAEKPSAGFESKLMQQIHIAADKQAKRKSIKSYILAVCGAAGILGIPVLIFWLYGILSGKPLIEVKAVSFFSMPNITLDPFVVSIGCVVLLLLVSDTLIRKRVGEKKHKIQKD